MSKIILTVNYIPSEAQTLAPDDHWRAVAHEISLLGGLTWKYWLRNPGDATLGGVYLFQTQEYAEAGWRFLKNSLSQAGASNIVSRFYEVDSELSAITRGKI